MTAGDFAALRDIRAVIFDADGVLLDSLGMWKHLGSRFLRRRGIGAASDLDARLFSMSLEQGSACLQQEYALPEDVASVQRELEDMLWAYYANEVGLKRGAAALLRSFAERKLPMALATSSPRSHILAALERNEILSFFAGRIFTTGELGSSKHQPDIYLLAAESLGQLPGETLVFEDSLYALRTAKAAGFRTVGVYDGGEPEQAALKEESEFYLENTG